MSTGALDQLKIENQRLRRQLAQAGVVQYPTVDLPNQAELEQLLSLVTTAHPKLQGAGVEGVRWAMLYLSFARKQPELNEQYYPTHWLDQGRDWLRSQAHDARMSLRDLVAAAVASGVAYSPLVRFPFDVALGLARGDVSRASNKWREVLAAGQVPRPLPLKRPVVAHAQGAHVLRRDGENW